MILLEQYIDEKELFAFSLKLTKNYHNAEDLLYTALSKALHNANKFDGSNIRAWIYSIIHNEFINIKRSAYTKNQGYYMELESANATYRETPDSATMYNAICDVIERHSDNIEVNLFSLSYQGFKYKELAEMFQIPIGTVKASIHRGRKFIQQHIN